MLRVDGLSRDLGGGGQDGGNEKTGTDASGFDWKCRMLQNITKMQNLWRKTVQESFPRPSPEELK